MRASPETDLRDCFAAAALRLRRIAAARGIAAGLLVAAVLSAVGAAPADLRAALALGLGLTALGGLVAATVARAPVSAVAARIERATPASRNLIQTSAELLDTADHGRRAAAPPAPILDRVLRDASGVAATLDLRALFPARHAAVLLATGALLWSATLIATRSAPAGGAGRAATPSAAGTLHGVRIGIVPPQYSGRPQETLQDPQRINALAGSRLDLTVNAEADAIEVETLNGRVSMARGPDGTFTGSVLADADGFIAIAPHAADGSAGARRLIGLVVTPDLAPRVRIVTPGRDLRLPDGARTVEVGVEAEDDLGLDALRLVYTRVSGSGENFTFTSGAVPLVVSRAGDRAWTARAPWPLAPLALEPGEMVIYRAVASDRRPGAAPAESDAFIIEITGPGSVPADGFAIDDRMDRYAISQQMVILKTEKLLAERRGLSSGDFLERSRDLAAEQRQVRAEFVFMMGGELADEGHDPDSLNEEEEAAGEDDLAAGRLANQGRADIMRAIRSMSRAAARLFDAETDVALPLEKEALTYLQRAFSRSRYILRTLGARSQLDVTRRLTGVMSDIARDVRPAPVPTSSPRLTTLRVALAEVAALATDPERTTDRGAGRAVAIAQQVLRLDPSSAALRDATSRIAALGQRQAAPRDAAGVDAAIHHAAESLAGLIRAELLEAPRPTSAALDALAGAVADAQRREARR